MRGNFVDDKEKDFFARPDRVFVVVTKITVRAARRDFCLGGCVWILAIIKRV